MKSLTRFEMLGLVLDVLLVIVVAKVIADVADVRGVEDTKFVLLGLVCAAVVLKDLYDYFSKRDNHRHVVHTRTV